MVAYEFYWCDAFGDAHLVGILPERRNDPKRISDESIMNWAKKIILDDIGINDILFSKVTINEF